MVDNASNDGTPELASGWPTSLVRGGPERSAQRNLGVELASGDWSVDRLRHGAAAGDRLLPLCDRGRDLGPTRSPCRSSASAPASGPPAGALERSCYLDDPALYYPRTAPPAMLLAVGGFDAAMAGPEDVDLRMRLDAAGARLAHCADGAHPARRGPSHAGRRSCAKRDLLRPQPARLRGRAPGSARHTGIQHRPGIPAAPPPARLCHRRSVRDCRDAAGRGRRLRRRLRAGQPGTSPILGGAACLHRRRVLWASLGGPTTRPRAALADPDAGHRRHRAWNGEPARRGAVAADALSPAGPPVRRGWCPRVDARPGPGCAGLRLGGVARALLAGDRPGGELCHDDMACGRRWSPGRTTPDNRCTGSRPTGKPFGGLARPTSSSA